MGLSILASGARRVTDAMFMAAVMTLRDVSPALADPHASLLPALTDIRQVARQMADAVVRQAQQDGVAEKMSDELLEESIDRTMWTPAYRQMVRR